LLLGQAGSMNNIAPCAQTSHAPLCERCDCAMKLVRTIPKLGGLPQLNVYRCPECGAVKTLELVLN
jgi:hypothetical protein